MSKLKDEPDGREVAKFGKHHHRSPRQADIKKNSYKEKLQRPGEFYRRLKMSSKCIENRREIEEINQIELLTLSHVVDTDNFVPFVDQGLRRFRADEAGNAGD